LRMIIGFRHKGLETFYRTGSTRGIQATHAAKLGRILGLLEVAAGPEDLNLPPRSNYTHSRAS